MSTIVMNMSGYEIENQAVHEENAMRFPRRVLLEPVLERVAPERSYAIVKAGLAAADIETFLQQMSESLD